MTTGIFPGSNQGAIVIRDEAGVPVGTPPPGAYVPGPDFNINGLLTALRTGRCESVWSPAQTNAFVSELLCLAEALDPTGTWDIHSLCNLSAAFQNWQNGALRRLLTEGLTLYVSTTGNDTTGDGTVTQPFRNISRAWEHICLDLDLNSKVVIIQLAPGAYEGGASVYGDQGNPVYQDYMHYLIPVGGGTIKVKGDPAAAQNYTVTYHERSDYCAFEMIGTGAVITLEGITLEDPYLYTIDGGVIGINECRLVGVSGSAANFVMHGGNMSLYACTILGPWASLFTVLSGHVTIAGTNTFSATPTFADAVAVVTIGGTMRLFGSMPGSVTGKRYRAESNGVISGVAVLPSGTIAGTTATGGQAL